MRAWIFHMLAAPTEIWFWNVGCMAIGEFRCGKQTFLWPASESMSWSQMAGASSGGPCFEILRAEAPPRRCDSTKARPYPKDVPCGLSHHLPVKLLLGLCFGICKECFKEAQEDLELGGARALPYPGVVSCHTRWPVAHFTSSWDTCGSISACGSFQVCGYAAGGRLAGWWKF